MNELQMLERALKVLKVRGIAVGPRMAYYEGRHPFPPGSDAWTRAWRERLGTLIDNQCAIVVETRADAVMPAAVEATTDDKVAQASAAWLTKRFDDEAAVLAETLRHAEATGEQVTVLVDWNAAGDVDFYRFDSTAVYVHMDRAGMYEWALHLWREDQDNAVTQATLYLPTETVHLTTDTPAAMPSASAFREVTRTPNPFGELMLAVVDKRGSLITRIAPHNDTLNQSMQTEFVVGENYANPFRAWLGFETYNPGTGEVVGAMPSMNPATGGRDMSIPTVADGEGDKREVIQFASPDPAKYLAKQDASRLAIARLGYIPAFMLQVGGASPASGEALEIAYRPHVERAASDWRGAYGPFFTRLARLASRMWLSKSAGRVMDAPDLRVVPVTIATSTAASRATSLQTAIAAGIPLEDALVEMFGMGREAARLIAEHADERDQARADRAQALAEQGSLDF